MRPSEWLERAEWIAATFAGLLCMILIALAYGFVTL